MRRYGPVAAAALAAAATVFVLLLPYSGNDSDPPECFSLLGYVVPCGLGPEQSQGAGFAVAGAVLSAALIGIGWILGRKQGARRHRP